MESTHSPDEMMKEEKERFFPAGKQLPLWEWSTHAFAFLSGVLIVTMALLVTTEVFMRYFLDRPLGWSVELSEYFMLYLTFLAAPWVLKYDQHVRVDVLVENLPRGAARTLRVFGNLLGLVACLLLALFAGILTYEFFVTGAMADKVLRFPKFFLVIVVPMSSMLMAAYFVRLLKRG